jgi:hypothetical protein
VEQAAPSVCEFFTSLSLSYVSRPGWGFDYVSLYWPSALPSFLRFRLWVTIGFFRFLLCFRLRFTIRFLYGFFRFWMGFACIWGHPRSAISSRHVAYLTFLGSDGAPSTLRFTCRRLFLSFSFSASGHDRGLFLVSFGFGWVSRAVRRRLTIPYEYRRRVWSLAGFRGGSGVLGFSGRVSGFWFSAVFGYFLQFRTRVGSPGRAGSRISACARVLVLSFCVALRFRFWDLLLGLGISAYFIYFCFILVIFNFVYIRSRVRALLVCLFGLYTGEFHSHFS